MMRLSRLLGKETNHDCIKREAALHRSFTFRSRFVSGCGGITIIGKETSHTGVADCWRSNDIIDKGKQLSIEQLHLEAD